MNLPSDAEEVLKWAERDGVDLTMLRERLGLTPTDRIRRHQNALELIDALKLPRSRAEVLQTELVLTALCDAEVSFILIGGMAAVAQGSAYVTADLDIFYERQNPNYRKIAMALGPFGPRLRGVDPSLPFALDESTLRSGMNFTLTTDAGDIDLCHLRRGKGAFGGNRTLRPSNLDLDPGWADTF